MRALFRLMLALSLLAGLMTGAVVHAAELSANGEVTASSAWLHAESDHDQVPADSDKNYPHHHNICHGHDLAAPMKLSGAPAAYESAETPRPVAAAMLASGPPSLPLRPPIA